MVRLRAEVAAIRERGRDGGIAQRLRQLAELEPREASHVVEFAELMLPAGLPEAGTRVAPRLVAQSEEVHALIEGFFGFPAPPSDPEAIRVLRRLDARALAWMGRPAEAVSAAVAGCGRMDDRALALLRGLAAWRIDAGDLGLAETTLESARRCAGHRPDAAADLGALLLSRGRVGAALRIFRELHSVDPTSPERRRDLVASLLAAGEGDEALALLRPACTESPSMECLLELSEAAAESRRHEDARDYAERAEALRTTPDPRPSILLGTSLAALGRRRDARAALERAVALAPEDLRAKRALEALERGTQGR